MRAAAIDDEASAGRIVSEIALVDFSVREVDGAIDVASGEHRGAAYVQEDEARLVCLQQFMNIPAIDFDAQQPVEVRGGLFRRSEDVLSGGGGSEHCGGHVVLLSFSESMLPDTPMPSHRQK